MSNEHIIALIRNGGHEKALDELYSNYPAFKNSFKKAGGKSTDAEDIFQDALLIFIEKISDQKFNLTCSINSFLFSICRNLCFEFFRKKGKEVTIELDTEEAYFDLSIVQEFNDRELRFSALDTILTTIGSKCLEILSLYYFKGLKMKSVALKMGFKSETSAKTQKYKCIEKARSLSGSILIDLEAQLS